MVLMLESLNRLVDQHVEDVGTRKALRSPRRRHNLVAEYYYAGEGSSGEPQHLLGIAEDITARKQAEEAQARPVAVITSSEDSIISMTLDGVLQSWNHGAERMYGFPAQEMIGCTAGALIPPDRLDEDSFTLGEFVQENGSSISRRDASVKMLSSMSLSRSHRSKTPAAKSRRRTRRGRSDQSIRRE
jgi:PAS domain-containing protein